MKLSEVRQSTSLEKRLEEENSLIKNPELHRFKQCYKISTKSSGYKEAIDFQELKVRFNLMFFNASRKARKLKLTVSSEENIYGMSVEKWFDGKDDFPYNNLYVDGSHPDYHYLEISELTEYRNIDSVCSVESYYQCLAKRFVAYDFSRAPQKEFNGTKCPYNEQPCLPFSLPVNEYITNIQICETDIDKVCYEGIIKELEKDQESHCKKTCSIKEYKTGVAASEVTYIPNFFGFEYKSVQPKSVRDSTSLKPFKTVKKEYFLVPATLFVGNTGGIMGLFFGFSFI